MATQKLTDAICKRATTPDKIKKLADGSGLYLALLPSGSKVWRQKYRLHGKEQTEVFGAYPLVTLKEARELSAEFRRKLVLGVDVKVKAVKSITFGEACAQYWAGRTDCGAGYLEDATRGLALHLKDLKDVPVGVISKDRLLEPLMVLNAQSKFVYARRIRLWASMVLAWAKEHGHCATNVADEINPKTAFGRKKVKHFASLKLREVHDFMDRLSLENQGLLSVMACRMLAYTWVRTKELRMMLWEDIEGDLWRLPDNSMKMEREHLVPLSRQALALLAHLKLCCRGSKYVFPQDRRTDRPMSENTVLYLVGRIGYKGLMTGHGWRSVASTWANEAGYEPDAIEVALSHSADAKDATRSAYNQAAYLQQRKKMLQDFSDWVDTRPATLQQADASGLQA